MHPSHPTPAVSLLAFSVNYIKIEHCKVLQKRQVYVIIMAGSAFGKEDTRTLALRPSANDKFGKSCIQEPAASPSEATGTAPGTPADLWWSEACWELAAGEGGISGL